MKPTERRPLQRRCHSASLFTGLMDASGGLARDGVSGEFFSRYVGHDTENRPSGTCAECSFQLGAPTKEDR